MRKAAKKQLSPSPSHGGGRWFNPSRSNHFSDQNLSRQIVKDPETNREFRIVPAVEWTDGVPTLFWSLVRILKKRGEKGVKNLTPKKRSS